jgi:hypothetical protein
MENYLESKSRSQCLGAHGAGMFHRRLLHRGKGRDFASDFIVSAVTMRPVDSLM